MVCRDCKVKVQRAKNHNSMKRLFAIVCQDCKEKIGDRLRVVPKCDLCNKIFSQFWILRRHYWEVHFGVRVDCNRCDKDFANKASLKRHVGRLKSTTCSLWLRPLENCYCEEYYYIWRLSIMCYLRKMSIFDLIWSIWYSSLKIVMKNKILLKASLKMCCP